MQSRKDLLVNDSIYHIMNKSIAGYQIFNNQNDYKRIIDVARYYQRIEPPTRYSMLIKLPIQTQGQILNYHYNKEKIVEIIAYCIMPTHIHFLLKQIKDNGISNFMANIENSYSRYFNTKNNRKGPLWIGRFKSVRIENDEQLYHLSRYIHLNPVSADLVNNPVLWKYSSYNEYIKEGDKQNYICKFRDILPINTYRYKNFVENNASYQRAISKIKKLILF